MKKALVAMVMACLLSGCGVMRAPLVIPTGEPISSAILGSVVQDAAPQIIDSAVTGAVQIVATTYGVLDNIVGDVLRAVGWRRRNFF